jgi:hypothetical protein
MGWSVGYATICMSTLAPMAWIKRRNNIPVPSRPGNKTRVGVK